MRPDLKLFFGPHLVGTIEGAFWSDNTGYGVFRPAAGPGDPAVLRVRDSTAFSEGWHERLKAGSGYRNDEWDAHRDVVGSRLWPTEDPDGAVTRIEGPVFIRGE